MPNALLEGAAAGRAIVATAVGGTPEIIPDGVTGLLVPSDDVDALRRALRTLVDDGELRHRLGVAAVFIPTTFGMDQMVAGFATLYELLVATSNHRPGRSPFDARRRKDDGAGAQQSRSAEALW